jgi:hypothetical protein
MIKPLPSHRKRLNAGQLDVLYTLYIFRFATSYLLAKRLGVKDGSYVHARLRILCEQKYIGRTYDAKRKLRGEYATYYLLSKGFRALQAHYKATDKDVLGSSDNQRKVLSSIYRAKGASWQFTNHCLNVFAISCTLHEQYRQDLRFFTRGELTSYPYFPHPLPDALIAHKHGSRTERFFLEVLDPGMQFFLADRNIQRYIDYAASGEWETTATPFVY